MSVEDFGDGGLGGFSSTRDLPAAKVPPQICASSSAGTLTDHVGTKLPKLPHS
ncbi:hypothetical protein SAMN05442782_8775 [Streptomyces sp. OK228]|nr:hypothetical protein SAMN05442782_8775 [Streptomyces sp. OK228]